MCTFVILLSTYNGEKYLEKQLNSILNQTFQDFLIFIRDDGSKDDTVNIIKRYESDYPDKIKIVEADVNLGYPDCFWSLLAKAPEAKYYAFCDQDDIWYETKLERAYNMLDGAVDSGKPRIYYHSYDICYDNDEPVDTYKPGNISQIPIEKQFFYTYTMGFTIVINNAMRKLLLSQQPLGHNLAHDVWTLFNAYYQGEIIYDDVSQACYRRHASSVTSSGKGKLSLVDSWIKKEILGDECGKTRNRLNSFLYYCKKTIPDNDFKKFVLFGSNKGVGTYFKKLFYPHRLKDSWGGELAIRILFLLNK